MEAENSYTIGACLVTLRRRDSLQPWWFGPVGRPMQISWASFDAE